MADNKNRVYEETYRKYLKDVQALDLSQTETLLGLDRQGEEFVIPLFDKNYTLTSRGLTDGTGKTPAIEVCVALLRYLLLCPDAPLFPRPDVWKAYRDFKDAGPLLVYFANDCEMPITRTFTGRIDALRASCERIGGEVSVLDLPYQVAYVVKALPMISLLVVFNDGDEEFPAACSLLYSEHADRYLDAECLAILAHMFARRLIHLSKKEEE